MPNPKPPYPPEFRREAIELVRISEKPIAQVARDLGVSNQTLRNWIKQADVDAGEAEGLTSDERAELNTRPRETLGFKTPADTLNAVLR